MTDADARAGTGPDASGDSRTDRSDATGDADARRSEPGDDADRHRDRPALARGGVYALLASLFDEPDEALYDRLAAGEVDVTCRRLLGESGLAVDPPALTVDEERETLCARFNSLFAVGHAEYVDRTDGTLDREGPPVSLYETAYRSDASWNDVNVDLARAYDYFGLDVDDAERDHHDYLPYLLEFAGYLARLEGTAAEGTAPGAAAVGEPSGPARARLDFLDRHLTALAEGVADRTADEPGTGLYGELAGFLDRFVRADRADLADRLDGGDGP